MRALTGQGPGGSETVSRFTLVRGLLATFVHDLVYGGRKLLRSPIFTVVAVITMALGIAANTVIFSAVHAILLRPLPFDEPQRLVFIWTRLESGNHLKAPSSPAAVDDYRQAKSFVGVAGIDSPTEATLTGGDEPAQIKIGGVTSNFFSVLGVKPVLGRDFNRDDVVPVLPDVRESDTEILGRTVILAWDFWQHHFAGDPQVLGQTLIVDGRGMIVVGVMPRTCKLQMPVDASTATDVAGWTALQVSLPAEARDELWIRAIARLAPGYTVAAAQAEMDVMAADRRATYHEHRNLGIHFDVRSMAEDVVGHVRPSLVALSVAVGFVLLIACANVANLFLARAQQRRQEMAIRAALGARRGQLIRQVLTEGLLVALLAGLLGVLLAWGGIRALVVVGSHNPTAAITLSAPVLGFTLLVTLFSALAFSLAPALESSAVKATQVLREHDERCGRRPYLRGALVVGEVALSLVLLIGAGLMFRTFFEKARIRPGFEAAGVLTVKITPSSQEAYPEPGDRVRLFERLQERIAALPGVTAVGATSHLPLSGRRWIGPYGLHGNPDTWLSNEANMRVITPGYFTAMRIGLLGGRLFTAVDNQDRRFVVIIDSVMAELLWPGEQAIGKQLGIYLYEDPEWFEVVGVVEPVRSDSLTTRDNETVYFPLHYISDRPMTVVVRAPTELGSLLEQIRRLVGNIDRALPVYEARLMEDFLSQAMATTRFVLTLIAVFAVMALLLAAVGLYGVLAIGVRQQTREIGIRMILGADARRIFLLVIGRGLLLALAGLACGLLITPPLTGALASFLYGVTPSDPLTLAAVSLLLILVVLVASFIPAHRATRVDPMTTLRH